MGSKAGEAPKTTESLTGSKTGSSSVATDERGSSLARRMSERRNSMLGGTTKSSTEKSATAPGGSAPSKQVAGPARDRQQIAPRSTDTSGTTTRSTERSKSGLASRFQSSRDRAVAEKNRQAGSVDVKPQSPTASANEVRIRERPEGARTRTSLGARLNGQKVESAQPIQGRAATAVEQQTVQTQARRHTLGSRLDNYLNRTGSAPRTSFRDTRSDRVIAGIHTDRVGVRSSYLHARYYDRPDLITHSYRHMHTYYDYHHRLHHRVIWPSYYYPVCYPHGSYFSFHYVWPYYHRKYVWVSLGGWWPYDYSYTRYYWYGYHPYVWYGYYPIAREVAVDDGANYNYYTYNYYTGNGTVVAQSEQPVDESTWAEVQEKLDQQNTQPAAQTLADTRFEEGVKSFESDNYGAAAEKFAEAMNLAPEDMILPYAYAQALFADGHYSKAADVLRAALQKVTPEKEGVFYPRGLYADDDVLYAQLEKLVDKANLNGNDSDLQLLLGYHLLGVGETGYAREPLEQAGQDPKNAESAKILLNLLEKMEAKAGAALKTDAAPAAPGASVEAPAETQPEAVPETPAAEAVPLSSSLAPAEQAAPVGPAEKPSDADKQEDNATGPEKSGTGGVQNVVPPGGGDNRGTPPVQQGGTGSVEMSAALEGGGARVPLRLDSRSVAGFAGLGFMTLLGCTAVGVQFRHLNDTPRC
jgi:Flp pilus assembly protein TadD